MSTEQITIKVDSRSLVDEVIRLVSDDELSDGHIDELKKLFEEECEERDLSDFSDYEVAAHFMREELFVHLDHEQVIQICEYHDLETKETTEDTIRDEQYEEVFQQLKEKFSVAELEAICNSK